MATLDELELYAIRTQSPLFAMASGILGAGGALPETFTLDASVAFTIGKILRDLARNAARRQLYVPLDVLDRHGVKREEIYAGHVRRGIACGAWRIAWRARAASRHAQTSLQSTPPHILPAFLPLALVGPQLRRMERAGYEPFAFEPLPAWRRQWLLWRAARNPRRIFG